MSEEQKHTNDKNLEEEIIELEFDESLVEYYIEDEDGNEVGVCLNEDGKQVEYYYEGDGDQYTQVEPKHAAENAEGEASVGNAEGEASVGNAESKTSSDSNSSKSDNILKRQAGEVAESLKETKDELMDCKEDMGYVARELAQTATDLKSSYDELIEGLNPMNSFKKKDKK